jgi:hypothetical protein
MSAFFSVYFDMVNSSEVNHYAQKLVSSHTLLKDATTQKNRIDLRVKT